MKERLVIKKTQGQYPHERIMAGGTRKKKVVKGIHHEERKKCRGKQGGVGR